MYRKDAERHIVRDIPKRLAKMRQELPIADWRMAVFFCRAENPDWFRHIDELKVYEIIEPMLRDKGVDMTEAWPGRFFGNAAPDSEQ